MSARVDLRTHENQVRCKVATAYETVVFQLPPVEAMNLGTLIHRFARQAFSDQTAAEIQSVRELIATINSQVAPHTEALSRLEPGRYVGKS